MEIGAKAVMSDEETCGFLLQQFVRLCFSFYIPRLHSVLYSFISLIMEVKILVITTLFHRKPMCGGESSPGTVAKVSIWTNDKLL